MAKKKVRQAIKPDVVFPSLPTFVRDAEADKKGMAEEEILLAKMAEGKGWQILREFINSVVADLDEINESAIANGVNFEELGRNTLVISLTKGIIKRIVDKVEDAKEARDKELDEQSRKPAGKSGK
jgi:hypothetical protein